MADEQIATPPSAPAAASPAADPVSNDNRSLVPNASASSEGQGGGGQGQEGAPAAGAGAQDGLQADPWFKGWVKPDGSLDHSRLDSAPDEVKGFGKLKEFKNFEDVVKSYAHLNSFAGKKGLQPLREGATEAEVAAHTEALRAATGAPKEPKGYDMARPEAHPEDMWSEEYASGVAEILHKHAAPPELARELVEHNSKWALQELEKAREAQQQAEDEAFDAESKKLKELFGSRYDEEAKLAVKGARHFGIDPDGYSFRNDADVVAAMARAAKLVAESDFIDQSGGQSPATTAKTQLEDMVNNPSNPFYEALRDKSHPKYREAADKMDRLTRQMSVS